jgi:hypothetical protein
MKILNIILEEPKQMPDFLTAGIMYLLPKSEDTKEQQNYQTTTYLSGITARRLYIWKNIVYYQLSKKDVTLEVKDARMNN